MSMPHFIISLTLLFAVGVSLGMFGSGGSIITLPVLVGVAGMPAHQAVGASLLVVGGTSGLGWYLNMRRGFFDFKAAVIFSASGLCGAWLGGTFTHAVPDRILLLVFGALMMVAGLRMMRATHPINGSKGCSLAGGCLKCILAGFGIGVLTGFLGVGGGFIIMPALVWFAGLELRTAAGTSLAIITFNAFGGLLGQFRDMNWNAPVLCAFLLFAMVGMLFGVWLAARCSVFLLRRGFASIVLCLGIAVIGWNLFALVNGRCPSNHL